MFIKATACAADMFTRREAFRLLGVGTVGFSAANAFLGCGDVLYDFCTPDLPEGCEDQENITRTFENIEINAPEAIQSEIASHLFFLQEFSGEHIVNLINRIIIFDPIREDCVCDGHPELWGGDPLESLGGFTDGFGEVYLRSEIIMRNEFYWQSRFRLPYTTADFTGYGGQAYTLSHELWHNITLQLLDREAIYTRYNNEEYNQEEINNHFDFEEWLANEYANFAMAAYLIRLNLPSSPVFEQFILPSLSAGEVTKERVIELLDGNSDYYPICSTRLCHERRLSVFFELGVINTQFEDMLTYDNIINSHHEMYQRWREHANDVLSQL